MPNFLVTAFTWTWLITLSSYTLPEPFGLASLFDPNPLINIYSDSAATVLGFSLQAAPPIEAVDAAINHGGPVVVFTQLENFSGFGTIDGTATFTPCSAATCGEFVGTWPIDGEEIGLLPLKVSRHLPAPVPLPSPLWLLTATLTVAGIGSRSRLRTHSTY